MAALHYFCDRFWAHDFEPDEGLQFDNSHIDECSELS
jgi:hypothetical protein